MDKLKERGSDRCFVGSLIGPKCIIQLCIPILSLGGKCFLKDLLYLSVRDFHMDYNVYHSVIL